MISQSKSLRKLSGGMKKAHRKKKFYDHGNRPTLTKLAETSLRIDRVSGASTKARLLRGNTANVYDPKAKKFNKVKIKTVLQVPSNRHYARANILTLGAVIDTEIGKAKVTSRPGQQGVINATLIQ